MKGFSVAFGQHISGLTADGRELHAPVFDENQVRAAAGLTLVVGSVAFAYAYFAQNYVPLQVASTLFFVEFLIAADDRPQVQPDGRHRTRADAWHAAGVGLGQAQAIRLDAGAWACPSR